MIWSHAQSIIATMQHAHTFGDIAKVQLPRCAVRRCFADNAVSAWVACCRPFPTIACFVDLCPEPIDKRTMPPTKSACWRAAYLMSVKQRNCKRLAALWALFGDILEGHNEILSLCRAVGDYSRATALLCLNYTMGRAGAP